MCATDCGACPDCRETDHWPRCRCDECTDPPPRERPADRPHAPALTVAAFEAALRRDGGSR